MKNRKQIGRVYRQCSSLDGFSINASIVKEFIKEIQEKYPDKELNLAFDRDVDDNVNGLVIYVYETLSEDEANQREIELLKKQFKKAVNDQSWTYNRLEMSKSQIPQYERKIEYLNKEIDDTIKKLKEFGVDYTIIQ
jgi:hypothetical protein